LFINLADRINPILCGLIERQQLYNDMKSRLHKEFSQRVDDLFNIPEFRIARSILLLGSVARDEQSCLAYKGELQCLSDIEALVFFDPFPDPQYIKMLQAKIRDIEQSWRQRSPLFHLDIHIGKVDSLSRLPHSILAFEMKERGVIRHGNDVCDKIPSVTPDTIDLGAVNELVLIRLWALLLYMPRQIVTGEATPFEEVSFRYIACRNALEVLTILYPNLGVLLPSYQERIDYLEQLEKLPVYQECFASGTTEFMKIAFNGKMLPEWLIAKDGDLLYQKTIDVYFNLIGFLMRTELSPSMPYWDAQIEQSNLNLRDKRIFRRNVHELNQARQMCIRAGIGTGIRWAIAPHRRAAICFLLHMHLALAGAIAKQLQKADQHLNDAEHYLSIVWPEATQCEDIDRNHFAQRWLSLRERFIPFMTHFYRFNRGKGELFHAVHTWTDVL
jgi:hypothetical protein